MRVHVHVRVLVRVRGRVPVRVRVCEPTNMHVIHENRKMTHIYSNVCSCLILFEYSKGDAHISMEYREVDTYMGWPKLQVSFAEYRLSCRALLH